MINNNDFKDLEQEMKRYPKLKLNESKKRQIHHNIMNVADQLEYKPKRGSIMNRLYVGISSVAVIVLAVTLAFSFIGESGQQSKEQNTSLNEYQKETQKSEEKIRELTEKVEALNNDYEMKNSETQFQSDTISNFQALLQQTYLVISNDIGEQEVSKLLGIFNPESVTKGSQVGSLTVQNLDIKKQNKEIRSYQIAFSGKLELKGSVSIDQAYGGYIFTLNNLHFNQVPHTMYDIKDGTISFKIENSEEFEEVLKDELTAGESLTLHAVFNNYTSNYIAQSHSSDSATFVELIVD